MSDKPTFKPSDPDSFDINISDQKGYKTLILSLVEISVLLLAVVFTIKILFYFSPLWVSPKLESRIFKNVHKTVFTNSRLSKKLTELAKKLDPQNSNVEVYIFPSAISNAFCFPGNKIFMTTTLLKEAESENELGFVLAHELGHAHYRHSLQNLSMNLVVKILFSSFGFLNSSVDFLNLGYSRSLESQADEFALKSVKKLYGHTLGAETYFSRIINENQKSKTLDLSKFYFLSSYISTHPNIEDRILNIKNTQKNQTKEIESNDNTQQKNSTSTLLTKKQTSY